MNGPRGVAVAGVIHEAAPRGLEPAGVGDELTIPVRGGGDQFAAEEVMIVSLVRKTMNATTRLHTKDKSPSRAIDEMIKETTDWRGRMLSRLRRSILQADPAAVEEVKWKKPSNPAGVPVWSHDGILCIANILKAAVRLTFPKGAQIHDPHKVFNTRLDSKTVRAIDYHEGETIDEGALRAIVVHAVELNSLEARER